MGRKRISGTDKFSVEAVSQRLEEFNHRRFLKNWPIDIGISIRNLWNRIRDMERYAEIIHAVPQTDVSEDTEFQRKYTAFFRLRRGSKWRHAYFELFEECKRKYNNVGKKNRPTFESVLRALYKRTGQVEASFTSKMLAAIDPTKPIWDSVVLSQLRIEPMKSTKADRRLNFTVCSYRGIEFWYEDCFRYGMADEPIAAFNRAFPQYIKFSDVKKLDFMIWAMGVRKSKNRKTVAFEGKIQAPETITKGEFLEKFGAFAKSNGWTFQFKSRVLRRKEEIEKETEEDEK